MSSGSGSPATDRGKEGDQDKGEKQSETQPKETEKDLFAFWLQFMKDDDDPFVLWTMLKGRSRELKTRFLVDLTSRGEATPFLGKEPWRGQFFYPWVRSLPKSPGITEAERAVVDFIANDTPDTDKALLEACLDKLFAIDLARVAKSAPPDGAGMKRLFKELRDVPADARPDHVRAWLVTEAVRRKGSASEIYQSFLALPPRMRDVALQRILDDPVAAPVFGLVNFGLNFHVPYLDVLAAAKPFTDVQKRFLAVAFTSAGGQLARLRRIFEVRFGLKLGRTSDTKGADWDVSGLKRMYPVLDSLPPAHIERNKSLIELNRYQPTGGIEGWYSDRKKEAAIGYAANSDIDTRTENTAGDPLHGKNTFDATVRHEVGHAVDRQLGWSEGRGPEASERGGWHKFGTSKSAYLQLVADMVATSNLGLAKLPSQAKKIALKDLAETAYKGSSNLAAPGDVKDWMQSALEAAGEWDKLTALQQQEARADPVFDALAAGREDNNPWYRPNGGVPIGGYLYQRSYGFTGWYRYEVAARARKVSRYQFRHPSEWFAEAYAAYYDPQPVRGATLAQSDPDTKRWFDVEVHPLKVSR